MATAAEGRVGLYRGGTGDEKTYRILLPSGKVKKGMLGSQGYPLPPEGHWTWLAKKKQREETRKSRRGSDKNAGVLRSSSDGAATPEAKVLPLSSTILCKDCTRDLRQMGHSHTVARHPHGAASICCRCVRRRGISCAIHERIVRAKKMQEKKRRQQHDPARKKDRSAAT